jgi:hypothetical protein
VIGTSAWALLVALAACSFPTKHPGADDAGTADAATPFGCRGQPFGTTAPPQITIAGQALDLGTGDPAIGTTVNGTLDGGGALFTRTADLTGSFSATIDTQGQALAGHVVTTAGTYVPSYFYPAHPFDGDTAAPLPMLKLMELALPPIANPPDTALAQLILGDCLGTGLSGCTLAIAPAAQRIVYARNGAPDSTATATDPTGYVLVYGVPPGQVSFVATCPSGALRRASIAIATNSTYFIRIEP